MTCNQHPCFWETSSPLEKALSTRSQLNLPGCCWICGPSDYIYSLLSGLWCREPWVLSHSKLKSPQRSVTKYKSNSPLDFIQIGQKLIETFFKCRRAVILLSNCQTHQIKARTGPVVWHQVPLKQNKKRGRTNVCVSFGLALTLTENLFAEVLLGYLWVAET